jgi:hypoxanthine phosphoribosyltransferase
MEFLRISWAKAEKMCIRLAAKAKTYKPEVLIAVSRGGFVPTRILSDVLDIHDVQVIRVQFYRSIGKTNNEPKLTQGHDVHIKGKRVLVIDDITDTGRSFTVAENYLKQKGPKELRFATLHYKPNSRFVPYYSIGKTDKWVIYPWEKHEVARELKALK